MILPKRIVNQLNITTLRSKTKEELVCCIEDMYRQFDDIYEALENVESDICMIKEGEARHVHDNP